MPLFLLMNWRWLAPLIGMAALGVLLGVSRVENAHLKAAAAQTVLDIQKQKTDAQRLMAEAADRNAKLAIENAEKSAQLDKENADGQSKVAEKDRRIADLIAANGGLRIKATGCGPRGSGGVPGASTITGIPPQPASGVEARLPDDFSRALRSDYRSAATVTEFARSCLAATISCYAKPANPNP